MIELIKGVLTLFLIVLGIVCLITSIFSQDQFMRIRLILYTVLSTIAAILLRIK